MLEQLQMLSVEQQAVVAVAVIFCLIILFKTIKMIVKVGLLVVVIAGAFYFFNQYEPTALEKAAKKLEIRANQVVEDVKDELK